MSYGEPKDVEGQCNAWLFIGDNFGDNHATMRCQLAEGHEGLHCERYGVAANNPVEVIWKVDAKPEWQRAVDYLRGQDDADQHDQVPEACSEAYLEGFCDRMIEIDEEGEGGFGA